MREEGVDYWNYFAGEAERACAPLYVQLARGVARDKGLREFAARRREGQPAANMLFGAAHYLLLRGAEHRLRRFYRTLDNEPPPEDDPVPYFRDFVACYREELARIVETRVTNTNEVGRAALLHAGFRAVAKGSGEPLNLIEIGPSAGLNMVWDRYAVRYRGSGGVLCTEPHDLPLILDCELRGGAFPPVGPAPRVASRLGLERNPVDLSRQEERDWLKALVWPDHPVRFERLKKAMAAYRSDDAEIRTGDALMLLPETMAAVPEEQPVCVYHTMAVYQFSEEARAALNDLLIAMSLRRPIWRLGLEDDGKGNAPLKLGLYRNGAREVRTLALCSSHGNWIEWRG